MITKSLSMEFLLYTAAQRQIKKAIKLLGIKETTREVVGVILGERESQLIEAKDVLLEELQLIPSKDVLNDYSNKAQYFIDMLKSEGFSVNEFSHSNIEKAILQRIALLALES